MYALFVCPCSPGTTGSLWDETLLTEPFAGVSGMDADWCREHNPSDISLSDLDEEFEGTGIFFEDDDDEEEQHEHTADQQRKHAAQESMRAQKRSSAGMRAPGTMDEVTKLYNDKFLLEVGKCYEREELVLRIREHAVLKQIPYKLKRREALWIESECNCGKPCNYKVVGSFRSEDGKMELTTFHEHTCGFVIKDDECVSYTARQISRISGLQALAKSDRRPTAKDMRACCRLYMPRPLSNKMCTQVREMLQESVYGSEEKELPKLGQYLQYLKKEGHHVDAEYVSKEILMDIGMEYQKGKHERAKQKQKRADKEQRSHQDKRADNSTKAWKEREPEVRAAFVSIFSQHPQNARYLLSMSVGFRAAIRMLPHLLPVLYSDATHLKGTSTGGVVYSTIALDANHRIVTIAITHCVGNERSEGWATHIKFMSSVIATHKFPAKYFTVIIDGFTSARQLFVRYGFLVFMCSEHLKKNIKKEANKTAYLKAVHANTKAQLESIRAQAATAGFFQSTAFDKFEDSQLFMAATCKTFGQHCQSPVEAWNKMIDPERAALHVVGQQVCAHVYILIHHVHIVCIHKYVCLHQCMCGFHLHYMRTLVRMSRRNRYMRATACVC